MKWNINKKTRGKFLHFRSTIDIRTGAEPEGYNLSYSFSLKSFFNPKDVPKIEKLCSFQ